MIKTKLQIVLLQLLPITLLIILWEASTKVNPQTAFYYGSPSGIVGALYSRLIGGALISDFLLTAFEAVVGFIVGNILGTAIGLSFWFSQIAFRMAKPYITVLGATPIFALAPLMMIWFGTGVFSKIVMATLSCVFIALLSAYQGAQNVSPVQIDYLKSYQANRLMIFRKVIVPASLVWVISAFKINIGFALLGAFIGAYISSNAGLGHLIKVETGLFNISHVLLGVVLMSLIAITLTFIVGTLEKPLKKLIVKLL